MIKKPFQAKHWVFGLILALHISGFFRFKHFVQLQASNNQSVRVAAVQGNIAQDLKWTKHLKQDIMNKYVQLSKNVLSLSDHTDLLIWPEASIPVLMSKEASSLPMALDFLQGKTHLQFGAPSFERQVSQKTQLNYYNSAFLFDPFGLMLGQYRKIHLVPFGEYVPFSDILPMEKIVPVVAGNFKASEESTVFQIGQIFYGNLICYESLFPKLPVQLARQGAMFLVNTTNDAWFDNNSGPYQHLKFSRLRSIETRKSLIRVANTGISAWFDHLGQIHQRTTFFKDATFHADVPINQFKTFYVRYPFLFPLLSIVVLLFYTLWPFLKRKR